MSIAYKKNGVFVTASGTPPIDDALSATSENPVQNKIVKEAVDSKSDTSHNHDDRYYTEEEENQIIDALQSTIVDSIYPVGSLYMSINSTMPSALATGRTWELLSGDYVLKTISSGTGGQASSAGATGSTTLTAAQSGVPAHSHGLNSHTHSIPALSGTAAKETLKGSMYNYYAPRWWAGGGAFTKGGTSGEYHRPAITIEGSGSTYGTSLNLDVSHSHSVTTNASTTGAASGSTANNSAANASQGHTHAAGMPQNIGIYVWKRTA